MVDIGGGASRAMQGFEMLGNAKAQAGAQRKAGIHGAVGQLGDAYVQYAKVQRNKEALNAAADKVGIAPDDPIRQDPKVLFQEISRRHAEQATTAERTWKTGESALDRQNAIDVAKARGESEFGMKKWERGNEETDRARE